MEWYWNKGRPTYQQKRIKYPETDTKVYDKLNFDKGQKCEVEQKKPLQQLVMGKLVSYAQEK